MGRYVFYTTGKFCQINNNLVLGHNDADFILLFEKRSCYKDYFVIIFTKTKFNILRF